MMLYSWYFICIEPLLLYLWLMTSSFPSIFFYGLYIIYSTRVTYTKVDGYLHKMKASDLEMFCEGRTIIKNYCRYRRERAYFWRILQSYADQCHGRRKHQMQVSEHHIINAYTNIHVDHLFPHLK